MRTRRQRLGELAIRPEAGSFLDPKRLGRRSHRKSAAKRADAHQRRKKVRHPPGNRTAIADKLPVGAESCRLSPRVRRPPPRRR